MARTDRDEVIANCWYNIGVVYKQLGKRLKAREMIQKALDLRIMLIGEQSLQVAMCQETLGRVLMEDLDYKSALTKFQDCY
jgi:tetratricopeptide (TPR) repeat protein